MAHIKVQMATVRRWYHTQDYLDVIMGFHRSPSGDCEQVSSSPSSETNDASGSTNFDQIDNSVPPLSSPSTTSSSSIPTSSDQCDQSLWDHVYNPS
jgi:hypothetical protein